MRILLVALIVLTGFLFGCDNIPTSPLSVVLTAPVNGTTLQSLTPVMTWVSLGANNYHVQIATDSSFQNHVVNESNINQLLYYVPAGRLTNSTTYFWRVRASKGNETGPWSGAWYFMTPGGAPTPPPVSTGTVTIATLVDGIPWSGSVSYTLSGPTTQTGSYSPQTFSNLPAGTYTLTYNSGGPSAAYYEKISPAATQTLYAGSNLPFNIHLRAQSAGGTLEVSALLNGQPWSGALSYTISGPMTGSGYGVPKSSTGLIPGTYTINYISGGPSGAVLTSISPSATETLGPGKSASFTFVFQTQQPSSGTIIVNATYDGAPWQMAVGSGGISYSLTGPNTHSGSTVPGTYSYQPSGTYTLSFHSGGPPGSVLASITPNHVQNLQAGGTIIYTLNFQGQARGTVHVTATLNGQPWSGAVGYTVQGPYMASGGYAPQSFPGAAAGTYTVTHTSGGPPSSVFEGVTPSSQILPAGGSISFNIRFRFQGLQPPLTE
jgi:hypothetical protein